jgi:hypothetical protein
MVKWTDEELEIIKQHDMPLDRIVHAQLGVKLQVVLRRVWR